MKQNLLATILGLLLVSSAHSAILEWSQDEIRTYKENTEAMSFRCQIAASDAFLQMRQVYHLPKKDEPFVLQIITEREFRKATYDYISKNTWERITNKKRLDELYQDSIDVRLLPYNDKLAGANVSLCLRLANKIGLSTEKYNKVMHLGLSVAKHLRKDPRYNYDVEVMDSLRNFLTKEQLVIVLRSNNIADVVSKSIAVWHEVKAAGLIENEDSMSCCNNAIAYYLQESVINDMFVGHEKVLKKNLYDLKKQQPVIVRMSESIKKKEELIRKKEEENEELDWAW